MPFDLGDKKDMSNVKLLTRQEIAERTERMTRDAETGEPLIIIPKDSELGEAITARHMHGCCRHFNLQQGQQDCQEQRFWDRMMREEKYRREWFDNPATYGVCPHFEGRLLGYWHPALVSAEDLDSSLAGTPKASEKRSCPYYADKKVTGSTMVMGAYAKTDLEH